MEACGRRLDRQQAGGRSRCVAHHAPILVEFDRVRCHESRDVVRLGIDALRGGAPVRVRCIAAVPAQAEIACGNEVTACGQPSASVAAVEVEPRPDQRCDGVERHGGWRLARLDEPREIHGDLLGKRDGVGMAHAAPPARSAAARSAASRSSIIPSHHTRSTRFGVRRIHRRWPTEPPCRQPNSSRATQW